MMASVNLVNCKAIQPLKHAIRTVKFQLQDGDERSVVGRWIIEGDLAS